MRIRPLTLTVLALAVAAAPASADAASGDRADARAFAKATAQLRMAVLKEKDAIEAGVARLAHPDCAVALAHVPNDQRGLDAAQLVFDYGTQAVFAPLKEELAAFPRRLDRVRTADRRLRRGRAAQRELSSLAQPLRTAPADLCVRLDEWARAGYPASATPAIDDPAAYPFAVVGGIL